jgi:hypothetical protein
MDPDREYSAGRRRSRSFVDDMASNLLTATGGKQVRPEAQDEENGEIQIERCEDFPVD